MADEPDRPELPPLPRLPGLPGRPEPKPEDDATLKIAVPDDEDEAPVIEAPAEEAPAIEAPAVEAARGDTRVPARRPERAERAAGTGEVKSRGWFSDDDEDRKATPEATRVEVADEPGWLERLSQTLTDLAADISSITVRTYTAEDVGAAVADRREIGQVGELRAWTRIAIDGDTDVCVPVRKGKVDQTLWALHQTVVEQAQTHRTEMLKALIDSVSGLWSTKK